MRPAVFTAIVLAVALPLFGDVEADLRRLTQENLDAIAPGRVEVWRRNLHEKFTHVDENNVRDASGAITGFADRREGIDVRWTKEKER